MSQFEQDHILETYKSVIQIALEGLKFLGLLNGGAAVAILAYLGNIAGKSAKTPNMTYSMACFLAGLSLAALAFFLSHGTQFSLYRQATRPHNTDQPPSEPHKIWLLLGRIVALLSLIAFVVGSIWAVLVFKNFTNP